MPDKFFGIVVFDNLPNKSLLYFPGLVKLEKRRENLQIENARQG